MGFAVKCIPFYLNLHLILDYMKLHVNKKDLMRVLTTAIRAVPGKSVAPIMDNFLIRVDSDKLFVTASDGNITITANCDAEGEGEVCVAARSLLDMVKTLPDCDIDISTEDVTMTIDYQSGYFTLPCIGTEDFPDTFKVGDDCESYRLDSSALCDALRHTLPCVATDSLRPNLCGVYFHNVDGKIFNLVSTDQHVLAASPVDVTDGTPKGSFIIPTNAATLVKDIATMGEVTITDTDSSVHFSIDNVTVIAVKVVGSFPNYAAVMPTTNENVLRVPTDQFISALRRVSICSNKMTQHIKLTLGSKVTIEGQDAGYGSYAKEELPFAQYDAEDMVVGFKFDVIMKVLTAQNADECDLKFSNPRKAILVVNDAEKTKSIVMPVAI